jgi:hypothetical protein
MPRRGEGHRARYPWPAILQWWGDQREAIGQARARARQPTAEARAEADLRKRQAEAALAELELAEAERRVLPIERYEAALSAVLVRLRGRILALERTLPDQITGPSRADRARQAQVVVQDLMRALAGALEEELPETDPEPQDEPPEA